MLEVWPTDPICKVQVSELQPFGHQPILHTPPPSPTLTFPAKRDTHASAPANTVMVVIVTTRADVQFCWDRDILLSCYVMQYIYLYGTFPGFFLFVFHSLVSASCSETCYDQAILEW